MPSSLPDPVDVVVAGAGIVGLATALALVSSPGPKPTVVVCDAVLGAQARSAPSLRAVAIAPASRRFLTRLGVWPAIASAAQPMTGMVLGDTKPGVLPAPTFLRFDGAGPDEPLAHMVAQDEVRAALLAACRAAASIHLHPGAVTAFEAAGGDARADGTTWRTRLLVAADGGRSALRERAGIATIGWGYAQTGIVATLAHSRDHAGVAIQHFLPGGPLAFLPMRAADGSGHRSSIVWSEGSAEATRLLALGPDAFCKALADRGGHERGTLTLEDVPVGYPLSVRLARTLVAPRLALVGDAARTVHPLAGQGLNLGLADAEALASRVAAAMALGLDPGATRPLAAYERDRRTDQVAMAAVTDGLNRLFSNDIGPLRLIRDVGLGLVDRSPTLKDLLARQASGLG